MADTITPGEVIQAANPTQITAPQSKRSRSKIAGIVITGFLMMFGSMLAIAGKKRIDEKGIKLPTKWKNPFNDGGA